VAEGRAFGHGRGCDPGLGFVPESLELGGGARTPESPGSHPGADTDNTGTRLRPHAVKLRFRRASLRELTGVTNAGHAGSFASALSTARRDTARTSGLLKVGEHRDGPGGLGSRWLRRLTVLVLSAPGRGLLTTRRPLLLVLPAWSGHSAEIATELRGRLSAWSRHPLGEVRRVPGAQRQAQRGW
jgi:hypothetical protein